MNSKKAFLSTFISLLFLLAAAGVTYYMYFAHYIVEGSGMINDVSFDYGIIATLKHCLNIYRPGFFPFGLDFVALIVALSVACLFIILLLASLIKRKPVLILSSLVMSVGICSLVYILMLVMPMIKLGVLRTIAYLMMAGAFGLVLFSIYFSYAALFPLLKGMSNGIKRFAGLQKRCCKMEKQPMEKQPLVDEETIRKIVSEQLEQHAKEAHANNQFDHVPVEKILIVERANEQFVPSNVPVEKVVVMNKQVEEVAKEEAPIEQVEEVVQKQDEDHFDEIKEVVEEEKNDEQFDEIKEEKVVQEVQENEEKSEQVEDDNEGRLSETILELSLKGKKKKASFETQLKNSEFDLRHKYYDLRDYILWYGLKNRISKPGDSFSYNRQRYAYITIVGKHLRLYIGLNPKEYENSKIPVEKVEALKYEDVPCMLRIKSDLSYRRAKKLIDDLALKIGIETPKELPPKETHNLGY